MYHVYEKNTIKFKIVYYACCCDTSNDTGMKSVKHEKMLYRRTYFLHETADELLNK